MRRLRRHYARAVEERYVDPEDIHQLRVCSRRAGTAVKALASHCPSRERRPLVRALREIRAVAGQARDYDVFNDSLRGWRESAPAEAQPAVTFLVGYALGERSAAQRALARAFAELPPKELDRRWRRVSKSLRGTRDAETLGDLIEPELQPRLKSVLAALDEADLTTEQLHALRIEGKRARYALELFAGCLDVEAARRGLEALAELQEILGSLNDSTVTLARLAGLQQRVEASDPDLWIMLKTGFELLAALHRENLVLRAEQYRGHRELLRESLQRVKTSGISSAW